MKPLQVYTNRSVKSISLTGLSRGFTLIELMISLTIGVLVVSAAIALGTTAANSRKIVKHMAELQEEAFFVTHTIRQQLAQTGFRGIVPGNPSARSIPIASRTTVYPEVSGEWKSEQVIRITNNTLFYRFDGASFSDGTPDGSVYDCLGNLLPQGSLPVSALSMQNNQLVCTVGADSALLIGGGQGIRVEQLGFSLGVDNNNDGGVDQIIDSSAATTNDFINTRHLSVRMLLATRDGIIRHNQTYQYNGVQTTATDHRLRTEVVVSVAIRN